MRRCHCQSGGREVSHRIVASAKGKRGRGEIIFAGPTPRRYGDAPCPLSAEPGRGVCRLARRSGSTRGDAGSPRGNGCSEAGQARAARAPRVSARSCSRTERANHRRSASWVRLGSSARDASQERALGFVGDDGSAASWGSENPKISGPLRLAE